MSFEVAIEPVARALWGEPNRALSKPDDLRFGEHGSRSVRPSKDTFFDHEAKEGGGVLDLVARETGRSGPAAFDWLREHGIVAEEAPAVARGAPPRIVSTYDYVDEAGDLVFQVVRMEPKTFRQRRRARADDDQSRVRDGWFWSIKDVRQVPYRLPELMEAIAADRPVFIVEGEKDVDNLDRIGVPATCNAGGAGKWPETFADYFRGADVVIIPDNDEAGRKHRDLVGQSLAAVARRVLVLDLPGLPEKGDVSDWIDAGGSIEALYDVSQDARPWGAQPFRSTWGGYCLAQINEPAPEYSYLIKGVLPANEVILVVGEILGGARHNDRDATEPAPGLTSVTGTLTAPLDMNHFGYWLCLLTGQPVVTGAGPYSHVFSSGKLVLPSFSLEERLGPLINQHTGVVARSARFELGVAAGHRRVSIELGGRQEQKIGATATGTPAAMLARSPFPNAKGALLIDGVEVGDLMSMNLVYDLAMEEDRLVRDDDKVSGWGPGENDASITGELSVRWKDSAYSDMAVAGADHTMEMRYWKSASERLTLALPAVRFARSRPDVANPGRLAQPVPFRAGQTASAAMLTATLLNGVSSYAGAY